MQYEITPELHVAVLFSVLQQQVSRTFPESLSLQIKLQWAAPTNTNGSSGFSSVGPRVMDCYRSPF